MEGAATVAGGDHHHTGSVAAAHAASSRGDWHETYAHLVAADAEHGLGDDDLELLSWAALLTGRPEEGVVIRQRMFRAQLHEQPPKAGESAVFLALMHLGRGAFPVASGWLQQASDLLAHHPDSPGSVWLAWVQAMMQSEMGDALGAEEALPAVEERARQVGVPDVEALARLLRGQIRLADGRLEEGGRLVDEVMALAVSGALGPFASAMIFCGTVSSCAAAGDFERAWAWSDEVGRCSVTASNDFPGDCRLHRAEMLRLRGDWAKAEVECASVCDDLATWHSAHAARAYCELGELSMRRGDLEAADEAFARARELGYSDQPGAARLALLRGEPGEAVAMLRAKLSEASGVFDRSAALPVLVEALAATGAVHEATGAVEELRALAAATSVPMVQARAEQAAAVLAMASGDTGAARSALDVAITSWHAVGAPYDVARCQVLLATADPASASAQLRLARQCFERLGAGLDVEHVDRLLGAGPATERVERAFMFTDIEDSTVMLARLGDEAWLDVLRRHHATLRRLFTRFGGEEVTDTGDGFFVSFPTADAALGCAMSIQREVEDVRVRIGVHLAEAIRHGRQYNGRGIHETARISATAAGGEIVVSRATLERSGADYAVERSCSVALKGLPGEMELAYLELTP